MQSTMMDVPLSLNHLLDRAGTLFASNEIVSRLPDKIAAHAHATASTTGARARLAAALQQLGLKKGDRVATLCLEPPRPPRVLLRHPGRRRRDAHAEPAPRARRDRLDRRRRRGPLPGRRRHPAAALPPVRRQARVREGDRLPVLGRAGRHRRGHLDYEALLAGADADALRLRARTTRTTRSRCATRRARPGRPKGVVYSHRSTVLHTLVGCLGENWGLRRRPTSLLPVTPMFHANCWGVPYGAVMTRREDRLPRARTCIPTTCST